MSAIAVCALLAAEAQAHPGDARHTHTHYPDAFFEDEYNTERSMLPATYLSLSLLSFAVGVAACLLVVRTMLPTLVRAHCAEIVRDYFDRSKQESGVKVVVIDREAQTRVPAASGAPIHTTVAGRHMRVDEASSVPAPHRVTAAPNGAEMQSILGHVYEQNVQLRDQLRSQTKKT